MEHATTRILGPHALAAAAAPSAPGPSSGRAWRMLAAGALATLLASPADAALKEYRLQFQPSPSAGVAGYTMHFGTTSGNYQVQFNLGLPPASGGVVNYALDMDDSIDVYVALRAYSANGAVSAYSSEFHLTPTPTSGGDTTGGTGGSTGGTGGSTGGSTGGTGGSTGGGGGATNPPAAQTTTSMLGIGTKQSTATLSRLMSNAGLSTLTMDSLTATGSVTVATCDLEGDGDRDLVLGFGNGSDGAISILTLQDGAVVDADSIHAGTAEYRSKAGKTQPACGDLDGDGRAEIVVGFGSMTRGVVQVFDDVATGFAPMTTARSTADGFMQIPVPRRFSGNINPAIGDIDGDGRAELVAGLTNVGKGLIVVLDDAVAGFAIHSVNRSGNPWYNVEPSSRASLSGGTAVPAVGDLDGDGRDEVVVGFGKGSRGRVALLDDAVAGWPDDPSQVPLLTAGRSRYQSKVGITRPALGDIDDDGASELVVGFESFGDNEVQVFDDAAGGMLKPVGADEGFVASSDSSLEIVPAAVR